MKFICNMLVFVSAFLALCATTKVASAGCVANSNQIKWAWAQNGYDQQIVPATEQFCWLAEIRGNWQGTGSGGNMQGAEVLLEQDGYWHIATYQSGDYGYAYCLPAYCFQGENSGYVVDWNDSQYPNHLYWAASISDTNGNGGCDYEQTPGVFPGIQGTASSLAVLQGWPLSTGGTYSSGDYAKITLNPGNGNTLATQTCTNESTWGEVMATASSIFVGSLGTTVPVYPYETGWIINESTNMDMGTNGSTGFCYMTMIQGGFRGATAGMIIDSNGEWWAEVNQNNGTGISVGADYACMGYYIAH